MKPTQPRKSRQLPALNFSAANLHDVWIIQPIASPEPNLSWRSSRGALQRKGTRIKQMLRNTDFR
jgi:hypothetical protein